MIHEILDRIYRIELPIPFPLQTANVFLIDIPPRTLVDTGIKTEDSFQALKTALETIGVSLHSIERILITHSHIDHYGLAKQIASLSGGKIFLHPLEYGKIRTLFHSRGILKILLLRNGVPASLIHEAFGYMDTAQRLADPLEEAFFLNDGDPIPFESMAWQAIHCPGHSPGLLCFSWKEKRVLFTGDHLLKEITPNPIISVPKEGPPFTYTSLKDYLASLRKVERMDLSLLLPGHGEEIHDPNGLIQSVFRHHRERMDQILSILKKGEKSAYEVATDLFPGVPPFDVFLGISEALGHLEILKEKGKVEVVERAGQDYYGLI